MNTDETMNALIDSVSFTRNSKLKVTSISITLRFYTGGLSTCSDNASLSVDPHTYAQNLMLVAGTNDVRNLMGRYIRVNKMRAGQQLEFMQHIINNDIKMNVKGEMIYD